MILRRLGRKTKLAPLIIQHFPKHEIYIEPFFGAGGLFFNKPLAKYNFLNDNDCDVFNLYRLFQEQPEELQRQYNLMPLDANLLAYWRKNPPETDMQRALFFLLHSNTTFMGNGETLQLTADNDKAMFNSYFEKTFTWLKECKISNKDYKDFLKSMSCRATDSSTKNREVREKARAFIYADPPYLNTTNNYKNGFSEADTHEMFEFLIDYGLHFAVSEFKNPIVLDMAKEYGLHVIDICERRTLSSRNTEILIMNYDYKTESYHNKQKLF